MTTDNKTLAVDVLAVLDELRLEFATAPDDLIAARAAVADLIEALDGLEQAYCRAGSPLGRDERMEDRKRLIAARAALARVKGESA
ncbi:hypothetical protein A7X89_02210 [Stenotrophomonas maltophilia]|nr:hypothetical protein A7X89_02210 [Stenotrophomonas maltophilia]